VRDALHRFCAVLLLVMAGTVVPITCFAQIPRGASAPDTAKVTAVRLRLVPESYNGPCPGQVQLVGEITTDGPGTVWYQVLAGAVSHSPEGTVTFAAAGTQTVKVEGTFRSAPAVPNASMLAIMEDAAGHHGPLNVSSGPVPYNITCTGPASASVPARQPGSPTSASAIRLPEGTTVEAEFAGGVAASFKPDEQVAFLFLQDMKTIQVAFCSKTLHRLCSPEEMLQGVKDSSGKVIGYRFKQDPTKDTNYRYVLGFLGEPYQTAGHYQIEAIPLRPGIGGFLLKGTKGFPVVDFYFNPNGAATTKDKQLQSYGFSGNDFLEK